MNAHRFEPCDGRRPSIISVVDALRGRTVAFVGDSTMNQLWTALVAELYAAQLPLDFTHRVLEYHMTSRNFNHDGMCTVSHTTAAKAGGSEHHFRLDARAAHTCNRTASYGGDITNRVWPLRAMCRSIPDIELYIAEADVRFTFYRMDKNETKKMRTTFLHTLGHCGSPHLNFDAKLDAAIKRSDVVIANIGVWYRKNRDEAKYTSDVRHVLSRLQTLPALGKLGLYRQSVPQHFPTPSGSGL